MSRIKTPLRVYKVERYNWVADCRLCLFIEAYNSHPLAMKAALRHHDDCLYITTKQTCHADALIKISNQKEKDNQ